MLDLAADHIICTHVHNNYYKKDLHAIPFLGDTDWETTMKILGNHKVDVPFSLELVYGRIPRVLLNDYAELMAKSCRYLIGMMEENHGSSLERSPSI